MDVNCGTLPSPPSSLCPPYSPALFPPSPSDLGFYSAHHSPFPSFITQAAQAASANPSNVPTSAANTASLATYLLHHQAAAAAAAISASANSKIDGGGRSESPNSPSSTNVPPKKTFLLR